ncbi:SDR family oxidoreductase [Paenibacillus alginolyticus]|uniref:SDR family oxidoreductase n=1 Tax=Paenibacillus alginolyticus TaxID=59839 RepID=A0ABT4G8R6_9BACL|nr:SDR family oxidoreductase [Paenibacillus alginolyticus]MCY9692558.1 SDR family oxidoreductase [Paenibacillus alginolyticus]MEC0143764.1 SDR family oxidoreductase [Paenibacillus alginolyticus]
MRNNDISYKQLYDLKGKTAIITGGVGILGQHFCKGLAEHGANIAVVDVNGDSSKEFAQQLVDEYKVKALGIQCNVADPSSVSNMVQKVIEYFGSINILHNNAASKSSDLNEFFADYEDYSLEQWREIMSVNIDGMFLVSQAVGKQMVMQGKGGSIIQTASIYGVVAPDNRIYENSFYLGRTINTPAVYSASKAAVIGLTKYLSCYWAKHKIRVNTLTPGGNESGQNDEFKSRYSHRVPLGRMGQPYEMVGAVVYLASDASSYVTGQNIIVDGGLSAW